MSRNKTNQTKSVTLIGIGPMGQAMVRAYLAAEVDSGVYSGEENNMIMMAAGAGHVFHTAKDAGINTSLPELIKQIYEKTVVNGHGTEGLTSVIEVLNRPS